LWRLIPEKALVTWSFPEYVFLVEGMVDGEGTKALHNTTNRGRNPGFGSTAEAPKPAQQSRVWRFPFNQETSTKI
jgi:hypothetical protein